MSKALIVIDAQEDFVRGPLGTVQAVAALANITEAVEFATNNGMEIFYTRDTHKSEKDYLKRLEGLMLPTPHCIQGTSGWQLCREALPREFDTANIIDKYTFGTIGWNRFSRLSTFEEIWICGFCTDICVISNFQILKALYPEVPIYVVQDACAGTTPEKHNAALDVMRSCQAYVMDLGDLTFMVEEIDEDEE